MIRQIWQVVQGLQVVRLTPTPNGIPVDKVLHGRALCEHLAQGYRP
jgi:hypothetical protein